MKKYFWIGFIFFAIGCATPLLVPQDLDVARNLALGRPAELSKLQEGHKLYINKCGTCHYLYRPHQFTLEKWEKLMPDMKVEAKLNDAENQLITDYILAMQNAKTSLNLD